MIFVKSNKYSFAVSITTEELKSFAYLYIISIISIIKDKSIPAENFVSKFDVSIPARN